MVAELQEFVVLAYGPLIAFVLASMLIAAVVIAVADILHF